jgi:hypothetical protein
MINPYVLIATHNRVEITKRNIQCCLDCGVSVIVVCSNKDEARQFYRERVTVIQYSNQPLGAKWQNGVEIAKICGADILIINGSDDILSPEFFTRVNELINEGYHFIGLKSWYVYDLKHIHHFQYLAPLPLGGGRVYSREMLEKIDYQIFDTKKDKHLDDLGWANVWRSEMKHTFIHQPLILSVKGNWPVMNPVEKMFKSQNAKLIESIYDPKPILEKFNYAD